ncbi:MAG: hypothetical protein LBS69_09415, partial [Prevotellaceae bacterium]|nr:hypothetical protein [Prevotellaceae bacterium]
SFLAMTCYLLLCQNKIDRNNVVLLLIFLFLRNDYLFVNLLGAANRSAAELGVAKLQHISRQARNDKQIVKFPSHR